MPVGLVPPIERLTRAWRRVDRDKLRRALGKSPLCQPVLDNAEIDGLVDTWFDADCCDVRR